MDHVNSAPFCCAKETLSAGFYYTMCQQNTTGSDGHPGHPNFGKEQSSLERRPRWSTWLCWTAQAAELDRTGQNWIAILHSDPGMGHFVEERGTSKNVGDPSRLPSISDLIPTGHPQKSMVSILVTPQLNLSLTPSQAHKVGPCALRCLSCDSFRLTT